MPGRESDKNRKGRTVGERERIERRRQISKKEDKGMGEGRGDQVRRETEAMEESKLRARGRRAGQTGKRKEREEGKGRDRYDQEKLQKKRKERMERGKG